jgi:hypothetical protein
MTAEKIWQAGPGCREAHISSKILKAVRARESLVPFEDKLNDLRPGVSLLADISTKSAVATTIMENVAKLRSRSTHSIFDDGSLTMRSFLDSLPKADFKFMVGVIADKLREDLLGLCLLLAFLDADAV